MIVVVGLPALRLGNPPTAGGRASEVALEATRRGSRVELIGACGDDRDGDALLIALATAGIGHAATLRDPSRPTPVLPVDDASAVDDDEDDGLAISLLAEAPETDAHADPPASVVLRPSLDRADIALGLAYLTSFEVLVVTDDIASEALPAALEAAAWSSAHLVLLVADAMAVPADLPASSTVLAAPAEADGGAFGSLIGAYAAALDAGASPGDAFATATTGWEALAGPG